MTIPPIQGGVGGSPSFKVPLLTAPVLTGVPPIVDDVQLILPLGAPPTQTPAPGTSPRKDPPISLAGRLEQGDLLPETTKLAVALESATRALQNGRPDLVLAELDAVWSNQLAADSPWYLRTGALQVLGRMDDAESVIRDAIARLPRSAALLYLLSVHTAHRGQADAARLANDHALALHPTEPLLWLQRAALTQASGMAETAAAILEHVQQLEPGFPAAPWLSTLSRLGQPRGRTPTPTMQRAVLRLTPGSLTAMPDHTASTQNMALPPTHVLESAIRYGLTLLESPTQSARAATMDTRGINASSELADALAALGRVAAPVQPAPVTPPAEQPSWDAIVLVISIMTIVLVPALRIPALMLCGASAMLLLSRKIG